LLQALFLPLLFKSEKLSQALALVSLMFSSNCHSKI